MQISHLFDKQEKREKTDSTIVKDKKQQNNSSNIKKVFSKIRIILWVVFCGLAVLLGRTVPWVFENWGDLRMEELVYTMTMSLEGTNPATIKSYIEYVIPITVLAVFMVVIIYISMRKEDKIQRIFVWVTSGASLLLIIISAGYFWNRLDISDYLKNQNSYSTFIDENYVYPESVKLTFPEKKRNLIYIYLESMETTYSDIENGGAMEDNVIPELTQIAQENEDFSGTEETLNGSHAMWGSTWTIAGMFAQTAGLPLSVSNEDITASEGFLPGITTLGDILDEAGYKNVLCIGTTAAFGERDAYFSEHGNYEIMDYDYSVEHGEIAPDYSRDWWGYDDSILYENAKMHLTELSETGQPFNFTMLTVDTHAEDGYLCDLCETRFEDNKYANVLACASAQLGDFLTWVQEQDFYENTTIVISGDHCTMDSDYCDDIDEEYERKVYTAYINPAEEPQKKEWREYSSMDDFPTTLGALGVDIEGNRLGLGVNLFSETPTLLETYGKEYLNAELAQKSELMENVMGERIEREEDVSFDAETQSIIVSISSNVEYEGGFTGVRCTASLGDSDIKIDYDMVLTDEAYVAQIPVQDFMNSSGVYKMDIYLNLPDGLEKWYCSSSIEIDSNDISKNHVEVELGSLVYDYNMDLCTITINSIVADADIVGLKCAVWAKEDQSDIVWYDVNYNENGTYSVSIAASDFNEEKDSVYNIHLYAVDTEENEILLQELHTFFE